MCCTRHLYREANFDQRADRRACAIRRRASPARAANDVVIVASSVSCIYGIGSVEDLFGQMTFTLKRGESVINQAPADGQLRRCSTSATTPISRTRRLPGARRHHRASSRPTTRTALGGSNLFGDEVETLDQGSSIRSSGRETSTRRPKFVTGLSANSHYVTPRPDVCCRRSRRASRLELRQRLTELNAGGRWRRSGSSSAGRCSTSR